MLTESATAITQVFGNGIRVIAVAIKYNSSVSSSQVTADDYQVEGRTIREVLVNDEIDLTQRSENGHYVIILLSPDDNHPSLQYWSNRNATTVNEKPPMVAGRKPKSWIEYKEAETSVVLPNGYVLKTTSVINLVVDDFVQKEYQDHENGQTLKYNFYEPKCEKDVPLPLVLFMHDASVTGPFTKATLMQGLGAVIWASPEEQQKRPCYVVAPQYEEILIDDVNNVSSLHETTVRLIKQLVKDYQIDENRIYATGQSGGCMTAIALNIKYPNLFAGSFLVAGQYNPELVQPMTNAKLWIMVSADDTKAFPGQNAITEKLQSFGVKIRRGFWDARWDKNMYQFAYDQITEEHAQVYYTVFAPGSVLIDGPDHGAGHRNTWRFAYTIEPIRQWLFQQHK